MPCILNKKENATHITSATLINKVVRKANYENYRLILMVESLRDLL